MSSSQKTSLRSAHEDSQLSLLDSVMPDTASSSSRAPQPMSERHMSASASSSALLTWWATPTVAGNYNVKGLSPTSGDGLATQVRMWATPQASDCRDRGHMDMPSVQRRVAIGKQVGLTAQARNAQDRDPLNPTWVEQLMGFPEGWTALDALPPKSPLVRSGPRVRVNLSTPGKRRASRKASGTGVTD